MAERAKKKRAKKKKGEAEEREVLVTDRWVGLLQAAMTKVLRDAKERGAPTTIEQVRSDAGLTHPAYYRMIDKAEKRIASFANTEKIRLHLLSLDPHLELPPALAITDDWDRFQWLDVGDGFRLEFRERFDELLPVLRRELIEKRSAARAKAEADSAISGLEELVSAPAVTPKKESPDRQPGTPIERNLGDHAEAETPVGRARGAPPGRKPRTL